MIAAWLNNCVPWFPVGYNNLSIHKLQWWFSLTTIGVGAWMGNYIRHKSLGAITYRWLDLNPMLVYNLRKSSFHLMTSSCEIACPRPHPDDGLSTVRPPI